MILTILAFAGLPGEAETTASVSGDVLTVDGVAYDLSDVEDGDLAELPEAGLSAITRSAGAIHATLLWRYSGATASPMQPTTPPVVDVSAGAVPDPITRREGL